MTFHLVVVAVRWPPETFLWSRYQALSRGGVRVTLVSSGRPGRGEHLGGVRVVTLPAKRRPILAALRYLKGLGFLARRGSVVRDLRDRRTCGEEELSRWRMLALLDLKPDVVHFEWNSSAIAYAEMLPIWNAPSVMSCRGAEIQIRPHMPGEEWFGPALVRCAQAVDAIHCVSDAIAEEAASLGLDREKFRIIRPAVDLEFFSPGVPKRWSPPALALISTGSLIWKKGWEYALQALRQALDNGANAHLRIVGDGPDKQRVQFTIEDLGLAERVTLLGKRPRTEVRDLLRESDAFVLASLSEGISNAVLEAMACGLPVITTDVGGMREAVQDGVEGLVVASRDATALATAIENLAVNQALRSRMGVAARAKAEAEFGLDHQTDQFLELYRDLARTRSL